MLAGSDTRGTAGKSRRVGELDDGPHVEHCQRSSSIVVA
jgi:hypothetical protein